ncbi:MAG: hypothetical protein GKS03_17630, partial [Alphaproteobacteria bacterium]|nr:hypothetical protein [Alphaproteobacteria bacterium]
MTVDLDANLNFVGIFVPQDALKIFEELFNATDQLIISGPILLTGDQNPPPLPNKINNFPWESSNPAIAGITLKADLGITPDLSSKLQLSDTYYWIFSPLTTTFWESNSDTLTYAPFTAFTSKLLIPSAGKTIPLESKMMKGLPQLVITAEFDETFSDLAELIDLAGTADLKTLLPAEIQSNLGQLALRDAAISFSHTAGTVGLNIQYVYLTIGMTVTPPWKTEDEAFEFDSIEAAFIVTDPFGTPTPSVVVNGEFKIDGVPVDISAGYPDFFITGNLAASQSLDLTNFMSEYLPGVTPPSPLTINSLDINIEPDVSYNFYTQMASDPPWDIPLGKSGLTISDVSFGFAKTFGATDYSGQFQGTLQYGDLETLYMNFTLPGSFEIRADFENVTLSGLIDWLVDSDDILPTGFDLTFVESVILITGDPPNYQLYFGT